MARRRRSKKYVTWRTSVFERDDYTCQACNRENLYLNCHHVEPWSKNKSLRYSVENGITLCGGCHQQFHELYRTACNERVLWYFILKVPKTLQEPTGMYAGKSGRRHLSKKRLTPKG